MAMAIATGYEQQWNRQYLNYDSQNTATNMNQIEIEFLLRRKEAERREFEKEREVQSYLAMMQSYESVFINEDPACNPVAQQGTKGMNYSTAIFLINKNARTIVTEYETDKEHPPHKGSIPRTTFKTLDTSIKKDDLVIVPTHTRHKMTVVKVVDTDVDVDFDSSLQMAWIIGKVDDAPFKQTLEQESAAIAVIRSAETRKKRDELREAVFADQAAKDAVKALPITAMNGDAPTA